MQGFIGTEKFFYGDFLRHICGKDTLHSNLDHALKCAMAGFQVGLAKEVVVRIVSCF